MTKEELSQLLHNACDTVNEGITSKKNENVYPRILYWSYIWEDSMARCLPGTTHVSDQYVCHGTAGDQPMPVETQRPAKA